MKHPLSLTHINHRYSGTSYGNGRWRMSPCCGGCPSFLVRCPTGLHRPSGFSLCPLRVVASYCVLPPPPLHRVGGGHVFLFVYACGRAWQVFFLLRFFPALSTANDNTNRCCCLSTIQRLLRAIVTNYSQPSLNKCN